jgi:uncharacterized protein YkwD
VTGGRPAEVTGAELACAEFATYPGALVAGRACRGHVQTPSPAHSTRSGRGGPSPTRVLGTARTCRAPHNSSVRLGRESVRIRRFLLFLACVLVLGVPTSGFADSLTSASALLHVINAVRAAHGLAPLRLNAGLTAAARQHSREMAADGYFAHASFDGRPFWQRIRNWYRPGRGLWSVGENLLRASPELTAAGAIKVWMASPRHRANLLHPSWRDFGFAAVPRARAPGAFRGLEVMILTADFGLRK